MRQKGARMLPWVLLVGILDALWTLFRAWGVALILVWLPGGSQAGVWYVFWTLLGVFLEDLVCYIGPF